MGFTRKNAYALRKNFILHNYDTAITKEDFEKHFTKTDEKVCYTFNGWDGKSYNGETRTNKVYRVDVAGYEDVRFVKVGKGLHYIDEDEMVTEEATGIAHPQAEWIVDIIKCA